MTPDQLLISSMSIHKSQNPTSPHISPTSAGNITARKKSLRTADTFVAIFVNLMYLANRMHPPSSIYRLLNLLLMPLEHDSLPNGPNDFYSFPEYAGTWGCPQIFGPEGIILYVPPIHYSYTRNNSPCSPLDWILSSNASVLAHGCHWYISTL